MVPASKLPGLRQAEQCPRALFLVGCAEVFDVDIKTGVFEPWYPHGDVNKHTCILYHEDIQPRL